MKNLILTGVIASCLASTASAGGLSDVIVEATPEVIVAEPASNLGWVIPLIIVGALIAVAASSSDDEPGSELPPG